MCLLYILVVLHWWSRRALNMQPSWSFYTGDPDVLWTCSIPDHSTLVTPMCFEHAAFLIILHWWPRGALSMQHSWSFYGPDVLWTCSLPDHSTLVTPSALNMQHSWSFYTVDPDVLWACSLPDRSTLVSPTCFKHAEFLIILHWWPQRALDMKLSWSV